MSLKFPSPSEIEVVIYHHPCSDGAAAAWVAHWYKKNIKTVPWVHGKIDSDALTEIIRDKCVLFVDCCPSRALIIKFAVAAKSIAVLDHHISAEKELMDEWLPGNVFIKFDMEHSGCILAFHYFFPDLENPLILQYIEERDLFKFKLENSRAITDYLYAMYEPNGDPLVDNPFFDVLDRLRYDEAALQNFVIQALLVSKFKQTICDGLAARAWNKACMINGTHFNIKITPCDFLFASDVGNILAQDCDFAVLFQYESSGDKLKVRCSFRSVKVDVSVIATQFGGGGHKNASGCTMDFESFNKLFMISEEADKQTVTANNITANNTTITFNNIVNVKKHSLNED